MKKEVKDKTGLNIAVKSVVFAKTYPGKRRFLSIYYYCEVVGGRQKAGEKLVGLRWIKPASVKKYFTTSLHYKLLEYLKTLE